MKKFRDDRTRDERETDSESSLDALNLAGPSRTSLGNNDDPSAREPRSNRSWSVPGQIPSSVYRVTSMTSQHRGSLRHLLHFRERATIAILQAARESRRRSQPSLTHLAGLPWILFFSKSQCRAARCLILRIQIVRIKKSRCVLPQVDCRKTHVVSSSISSCTIRYADMQMDCAWNFTSCSYKFSRTFLFLLDRCRLLPVLLRLARWASSRLNYLL